MASVSFKSFKWDQAGYRELLGSAGVQSVVASKAQGIASRANASMPANGYTGTQHHKVVDATKTKFSPKGKLVVANTNLAKYQQARHKTLTKSIGG